MVNCRSNPLIFDFQALLLREARLSFGVLPVESSRYGECVVAMTWMGGARSRPQASG